MRHEDTHSGPVHSSSSCDSHSSEEAEWVISLTHGEGSTSPWHTEADTETSTPPYKRGRHQLESHRDEDVGTERLLTEMALIALARGSPTLRVPKWMAKLGPPSMLILANARLQRWPLNDPKCVLRLKEQWCLAQWNQAIRTRIIDVEPYPKILIYFKLVGNIEVPDPLKNSLEAVCRSVRSQNKECLIYICNLLPHLGAAPILDPSVKQTNESLLQAVTSINRKMTRVHYLSIHEHFASSSGLISPSHRYFCADGHLTRLGCLTFRECLFREAGMKTYWFEEQSDSRN